MREAVAAKRLGCFARYVDEVYRHLWADPKKMGDPEVLRSALAESLLPVAEIVALSADSTVPSAPSFFSTGDG